MDSNIATVCSIHTYRATTVVCFSCNSTELQTLYVVYLYSSNSIRRCSMHENKAQSIITCVCMCVCFPLHFENEHCATHTHTIHYWMPVFNILAYRLPFSSITTITMHDRMQTTASSQCIFINITIQNCHIFHLTLCCWYLGFFGLLYFFYRFPSGLLTTSAAQFSSCSCSCSS